MSTEQSKSILFDLLRSFVSLAGTLNLARTVEELGSTRQTVKRHIAILEQTLGHPLFEVLDRQYQLTTEGKKALPEAEEIINRGNAWLAGQTGHIDNLFQISINDPDGTVFFLQQHPLSDLWRCGSPFLNECLRRWIQAEGQIEHPALASIRPYSMIFRPDEDEWTCVEVGPESSYANWFGWACEKSSVGRRIASLPGGSKIASLISRSFNDVYKTAAMQLDHVHTEMNHPELGDRVPMSYMRLILGCRFADDSFALVSIVERGYDISIDGLDQERIESMPPELILKVDVNNLDKLT